MTNVEIANLLREIAASYTVINEKKFYFQIIAYQRAADSIEKANTEVKDLWTDNKLSELSGVGPTIAGHLDELLRTGKVKHFEEIKKGVPASLFPLIKVPRIGAKTAEKLIISLKLANPDSAVSDLEKAAGSGKIASIPGFGEKTEKLIIQSIAQLRKGKTKTARMVLPYAYDIAGRIVSHLKQIPETGKVEVLGSLRRMTATVGDIDIAVTSSKPAAVIDWFLKYPGVERVIEAGDTTSSILVSGGKQVDLMIQPLNAFGALLAHFTGSKEHNIHLRSYAQTMKLSLSEYGIKSSNKIFSVKYQNKFNKKLNLYQFSGEEEFYKSLGLSYIPPELREDNGEIELAKINKLPDLIETKDVKGDFHLHSSFNIEPSHDLGSSSIDEMFKKAKSLGYQYMAFSEHNPSITNHSINQIKTLLSRRNSYIEHLNTSTKSVHIFKMMEIDILANGQLALSDDILDCLDAGIASIHSGFIQDRQSMTKRIINGLSHDKIKILGHPTGRLLNQREGYEADWREIFSFSLKNNKALEINAYPTRLDLPDTLVHEAVKMGVLLVIDTDSHAEEQMELMKFGVAVARRGWAKADNVVNTWPLSKVKKWLLD